MNKEEHKTSDVKEILNIKDLVVDYETEDGIIHAVNGVSLTVCDSTPSSFRVAIIPYTFEHTNFGKIEVGSTVNLEFDIIGKYIARIAAI